MTPIALADLPDVDDHSTAESIPRQRVRKVLHVVNGEVYGGAERALDLLALQLGEHDIEMGFVCLKPALFPVARRAQSTPLFEMPMRGRWDLRPAWKIARLVREQGYDAVYAHTARSALIAALVFGVRRLTAPRPIFFGPRTRSIWAGLIFRMASRVASLSSPRCFS